MISVELRKQPVLHARLKYPPALIGSERPVLTEGIAELGQASLRGSGNHLLDNQVHILVCPAGILDRDRVSSKESRD